jgi:hypothetical protein
MNGKPARACMPAGSPPLLVIAGRAEHARPRQQDERQAGAGLHAIDEFLHQLRVAAFVRCLGPAGGDLVGGKVDQRARVAAFAESRGPVADALGLPRVRLRPDRIGDRRALRLRRLRAAHQGFAAEVAVAGGKWKALRVRRAHRRAQQREQENALDWFHGPSLAESPQAAQRAVTRWALVSRTCR